MGRLAQPLLSPLLSRLLKVGETESVIVVRDEPTMHSFEGEIREKELRAIRTVNVMTVETRRGSATATICVASNPIILLVGATAIEQCPGAREQGASERKLDEITDEEWRHAERDCIGVARCNRDTDGMREPPSAKDVDDH